MLIDLHIMSHFLLIFVDNILCQFPFICYLFTSRIEGVMTKTRWFAKPNVFCLPFILSNDEISGPFVLNYILYTTELHLQLPVYFWKILPKLHHQNGQFHIDIQSVFQICRPICAVQHFLITFLTMQSFMIDFLVIELSRVLVLRKHYKAPAVVKQKQEDNKFETTLLYIIQRPHAPNLKSNVNNILPNFVSWLNIIAVCCS